MNAIEACGLNELDGATLYVSLEPCCHEGKTPPCTDAILQAGIKRVVVASDDPTEKASGRGLGILRDEGVEVVVADGELATQARLLNQAFRKHARVGRPWVLFKSAMTLDGKVATRSGDSKWISGEESRELAHRWRASVDADRRGHRHRPRRRPAADRAAGRACRPSPRRSRGAWCSTRSRASRSTRSWWRRPRRYRSRSSSRARPPAPTPTPSKPPARRCWSRPARTSPRACARRSTSSARWASPPVLLEGGPHLAGAFLDAGEIDELRLFLAPLLLGGSAARDPLEGEGVERISEALHALTLDCESVGEDLLISARLREW